MSNSSAISSRDVSVTYSKWGQDVHALREVNLEVRVGEWLMMIGDNGSGKSTYLKTLCGRCQNFTGDNVLLDVDASRVPRARLASLAYYLHQDPALGTAPGLTICENLIVADHSSHGRTRRSSHCYYKSLLEPFGLSPRLDQLVQYLSGGERQLLALLMAELRPNPILLLDEPLAALSPTRRSDCLRIVERLSDSGRTILQVTHDHEIAMTLGHRTVRFNSGAVSEVARHSSEHSNGF